MAEPTIAVDNDSFGDPKPHDSLHGQRIGPYHILELLGEGGMGEVYKAEQRHPIRRTVAIKIIKLGFNSKEVIARFESERQALARMDHPHVARVIDAGTTDVGRPYFVMEYVPGTPITRFADTNKLSIEQRLKLFVQACQAVAHAHTKAIIHRDIKSSNVLAYLESGEPTVKVIDFGIAKAVGGDRLTDRTFNTNFGQVVGTYESMSPEQAEGSPDIDTRTDVYSLGVLLYELLTGAKPFDPETLAHAADLERRRIIREVEPPRPSTRVSSLGESALQIATARQSKIAELARNLRDELEWIPLKAMRKERERRYANSTQLAEDIGNYLAGKPLIAAPESRVYRFRKFAARHRAAFAGVTTALLVAIGATAFYVSSIRAEQRKTVAALRDAKHANQISEAVNSFLNEMLRSADPEQAQGKPVLVIDVLKDAQTKADRELAGQPLVLASVLESLATTFLKVGERETSLPPIERAVALFNANAGPDDRRTISAIDTRSSILRELGKLEESESDARRAATDAQRLFGPDDRLALAAKITLGLVLQARGKLVEAEPVFRDALDRRSRAFGRDDPDTLNSIHNLACQYLYMGRFADAEPPAREAVTGRTRVFGNLHPDTLASLQILASVLFQTGRFAESEAVFQDLVDRCTKVYGLRHRMTSLALADLGRSRFQNGKAAQGEADLRQSLEVSREVLGADDWQTLQLMNDIAFISLRNGKPAEAELLQREVVRRTESAFGKDYPQTIDALGNLAATVDQLGSERAAEAEQLGEDALARKRRVAGDNAPITLRSMAMLGSMYLQHGANEKAIALLKELCDRTPAAQLGATDAVHYTSAYGLALQKLSRDAEAIPPLEAAEARCAASELRGTPVHRKLVQALVASCQSAGSAAGAAKWSAVLTTLDATTRPATQSRP